MKKLIDNLLLFLIALSIVQLVLEEVGIILNWQDSFGLSMVIAGFIFDLIFSIEFLVRSVVALKNGKFKTYFLYENGWIDFVASLPLLLSNSGPLFFMTMTGRVVSGGGRSMANLIKVIKAIRVTRILRLLRTLKIFGKIENVSSKMSQHHVSMVTSLVVSVSVLTFMLMTGLGFISFDSPIQESKVNLTFTLVIIMNVVAIAVFYAKSFAQNISDPIWVIKRGLTEDQFNYTVKIKPQYRHEEIFELARTYNEDWLPLKVRIRELRRRKQDNTVSADDDYSDLL